MYTQAKDIALSECGEWYVYGLPHIPSREQVVTLGQTR